MGIIQSGGRESHGLRAGQILTCVTSAVGGATVYGYVDSVADGQGATVLATMGAGATQTFGPYRTNQRLMVEATRDRCTVSIAESDDGVASASAGLADSELATVRALVSTTGILWANRASAASNANALQWFSDVGPAGTLMKSDGVNWRSLGGYAALYSSASPIIVLSSATFANTTGSITGLTALPYTPAGVVRVWVFAGAGIAVSGLYFATFSSATACQLYTDAAGTVTPTGITAGAYAGGTTEALIPLVTVQGGLLGLNGGLRTWARYSSAANNANVKTVAVKFGGTSVGLLPALTSGTSNRAESEFRNRGIGTSQSVSTQSGVQSSLSGTVSGTAWAQAAIDTTADRVLAVGFTNAVATDSVILEECTVELIGG